MSNYQEGCRLKLDEIAAVLSLAGKRSVVGFQTAQIQALTPEAVWNGCCRLMQDGMMTQIDGKFRLCPELVEVMQPVCQADTILALTPASDLLPQVIYYGWHRVVCMEQTVYGSYILTPLGPEDICADLQERMELEYSEEAPGQDAPLQIDVQREDPREKLLQAAQFVLERLDSVTGARRDWLRLVRVGMDQWLQWTQGEAICCEALTPALLQQRLQVLLRGDTV